MLTNPNILPGPYPGPGQAFLLRDNCQQWLLQQQLLPAGGVALASGGNPSASIAVQLERINRTYYPFGLSFQVAFTNVSGVAANPGAFELDIQSADIDADQYFVTLASAALTGGLNASYQGRLELPPTSFWAKYIRAYVKTLGSAVYASVLASR
jgi:hypothetical protein